jgi:hypothetical protein
MYYSVKFKTELRKDGNTFFECPFCFTKYKKNNEPSKNAKNVIHNFPTNTLENYKITGVCKNLPPGYTGFEQN